jgi:hypothetical protein
VPVTTSASAPLERPFPARPDVGYGSRLCENALIA